MMSICLKFVIMSICLSLVLNGVNYWSYSLVLVSLCINNLNTPLIQNNSRLWCLTVSLSLSDWYPGSGVVLDCIDI